jgi:hypothetical protein
MNNQNLKLRKYTEKLFLAWVKEYSGPFTYCREIREWMSWNKQLKNAGSLSGLKAILRQSDDFDDRHLQKVDKSFSYFEEQLATYLLEAIKILLGVKKG